MNSVRAVCLGSIVVACAFSAYSELTVAFRDSLIQLGESAYGPTDEGNAAMSVLLKALESQSAQDLEKARNELARVVENKEYAGEYGALVWFCEYLTDENVMKTADPVLSWYASYFTDNENAFLKEYLARRLKLTRSRQEDALENILRAAFLEQFLVLNSPLRDKTERPDEIIAALPLEPGSHVLDFGCGFGYYAGRLSNAVGEKGVVYAVDADRDRARAMRELVQNAALKNVRVLQGANDDVVLRREVDLVFMSSVYWYLYVCETDAARAKLLQSLRNIIKDHGHLAVADSRPVANRPVSGIAPELVTAQLAAAGFTLESATDVTACRYLLIFKKTPGNLSNKTAARGSYGNSSLTHKIPLDRAESLIHIGSIDSFDITPGGIEAAKYIVEAIDAPFPEPAPIPLKRALEIYERLIPAENFGGEYTALEAICQYFLAEAAQREKFLRDPLDRAYFKFFTANKNENLRDYLLRKYELDGYQPLDDPKAEHDRRVTLEDFILFNNPRREQWEKTSRILQLLPLEKDHKILDIGCGPGYYAHRFSSIVGPAGHVYAIDTRQEHVDYLSDFVKDQGITNVTAIRSREDDVCIADEVDVAFMCSLYHIIYALPPENVRDKFIASIRRVLKPGGKLIIIDNGPVKAGILPYHGCYIDKDLVIAQVQQYGFRLESFEQIVPQRYMLVFDYSG